MTTAAWMMLVPTWLFITYFTVTLFLKVMRQNKPSDNEEQTEKN